VSQHLYIIGVDPGSPLHMALLDPRGNILKVTSPEHVATEAKTGWSNNAPLVVRVMNAWLEHGKCIMIGESVSARAGQGLASTSKYIGSLWMLKGIAAAMGVPFHEVTPNKWKNELCLQKSAKQEAKETSRQFAMNVWPDKAHMWPRKKDHDKAEAALIALWGHRVLLRR